MQNILLFGDKHIENLVKSFFFKEKLDNSADKTLKSNACHHYSTKSVN